MRKRKAVIKRMSSTSIIPSIPASHVVTEEEIKLYRKVSTSRKIEWLDEMRQLFFAAMTPVLSRRWNELRKRGY